MKGTSWFCPGCREIKDSNRPCLPCGFVPFLVETSTIKRNGFGRIVDVQAATTRSK